MLANFMEHCSAGDVAGFFPPLFCWLISLK